MGRKFLKNILQTISTETYSLSCLQKTLHCNNMKSKPVKDISLLSYSFIDTYLETRSNEFRILIFPSLDIQQSKSVTSCILVHYCLLLGLLQIELEQRLSQETDYCSQHQYQRESQECSLLALCCFDKKGVYSREHYHAEGKNTVGIVIFTSFSFTSF